MKKEEYIRRLKEGCKRRSQDPEYIKKISKPRKHHKYDGITKECKCCKKQFKVKNKIDLEKTKYCGYDCANEAKMGVSTKKIRNHCKGENHHWFGKTPTNFPKRSDCRYNGVTMRSSWETTFARFFDAMSLDWEYEPSRFRMKFDTFTYLPDFYLPNINMLVEIKGIESDEWKNKFQHIKDNYPTGFPEMIYINENSYNDFLELIKQGD